MNDIGRSSASAYPIVQGIQLRSTHELPDRMRSAFNYPVFNAVQSKCFDAVFGTNDNFVLSAPTSSGKTAVLELAICRLLAQAGPNDNYKIIYQAPTRSLCAERQTDWQTRFNHLGLKCAELTGDTDQSQLRSVVQHADIIVTTPEKWDSMTRKWKDHDRLMRLVKLFLIDEVHILNEDRGASLEAVVSRMKSIGSNVRFVALSATVPNSDDIAIWLGRNSKMQHVPAIREVFGEKFRPVRLTKYVVGVQANGMSDFAMDVNYSRQLPDIISTYGKEKKPIMVFCFTRVSTEKTAKSLAEWWKSSGDKYRFWETTPGGINVGNAILSDCVKAGVAFHHAGLDVKDRTAVEKGYLAGSLNVICCTSTLAVGVNLPCHMVIIKNTVSYNGEGCKEYSDLEVMQMLGRAGRPQFDRTGVAVILTRQEKVERYEKMVSGQEVLESRLHHNLIDHLNAEIGLGTVFNDESAKVWLQGTFFFVRFNKNPGKYQLEGAKLSQNADEVLQNVCKKDLELLRDYSLIDDEGDKFTSTEFGDAMARYYVHFNTMKLIISLQPKPRLSEILSVLAQASEFKSIRFRATEKQMFRQINSSPSIRFPIKVDLALPAHKVSLIIQAILGGIDLKNDDRFAANNSQFSSESALIFQHVHRLIRCIIDCQLQLEDSIGARNALDLARSLGARAWDDSPLQLVQVDQVGHVAVRKLVSHGIKTIEDLESTEAYKIEMYLSKNPPFGSMLLSKLKYFPKLRVDLKLMGKPVVRAFKDGQCLQVHVKAELGFINETPPEIFMRKAVHVILLAETSDGRKIHFYRTSGKKLGNGQDVLFTADLTSHGQFINCYVSCDDIAGTLREARLDPKIPATMFPTGLPTGEHRQVIQKVSKSRAISYRKTSAGSREFEDLDIEDADMVAAEDDCFADIDELDLTIEYAAGTRTSLAGNGKQRKPALPEVQTPPAGDSKWHPMQLSNGKWMCKHACKDKHGCGHACCKEGLNKPQKPSKPSNKESKSSKSISETKKSKPTKDYFMQSKAELKSLKSTSQLQSRKVTPKFPYPDRQTKQSSPTNNLDEEQDMINAYHETISTTNHNQTRGKSSGLFLTDTSSPEKFVQSNTVNGENRSNLKRSNIDIYEDLDDEDFDDFAEISKKRRTGEVTLHHQSHNSFMALNKPEYTVSPQGMSTGDRDEISAHESRVTEFDDEYSEFEMTDHDVQDPFPIACARHERPPLARNTAPIDALVHADISVRTPENVQNPNLSGYMDILSAPNPGDADEEDNPVVVAQPALEGKSEREKEVDEWLMREFGDIVEFV